MMIYVLIIVGFVLLIKGADLLVEGASSIARALKVSDLVIGLTIVAFGTSTPELVVNVFAAVEGNAEIAIGNVVGSNIFNILIILGLSSMIFPLIVTHGTVWIEIPMTLAAAALLGLKKSILMIILGLAGLFVGAKFVVDGAVKMASALGVSESLIALTIVAAGTSLPELATSVVAAYKKNSDIAVGNIVGSNIFNIFLILGVSALIRPIPLQPKSNIDIGVAVFASFALFIVMFTGKKGVLDRWGGFLFVASY